MNNLYKNCLIFIPGHVTLFTMGLLYTKFYLDLEPNQWKEISHNPAIFEAIDDDVSLEIYDVSQNSYKLKFKKGGKLQIIKVVGKFRLTWADEDVI